MTLLPWGTYTLEIAQSPDVVCRRLQYETTKSYASALMNYERFYGNVNVEAGEMKLRYTGFKKDSDFYMKNSFRPEFYGTAREENGKTVLRFKWHLSAVIFAFLAIFIGLSILIEIPFFLIVYAFMIWGLNVGLKEIKEAVRETIIMPGESWREYEGDKGDEWNV